MLKSYASGTNNGYSFYTTFSTFYPHKTCHNSLTNFITTCCIPRRVQQADSKLMALIARVVNPTAMHAIMTTAFPCREQHSNCILILFL